MKELAEVIIDRKRRRGSSNYTATKLAPNLEGATLRLLGILPMLGLHCIFPKGTTNHL
jgi:hypothetical protein